MVRAEIDASGRPAAYVTEALEEAAWPPDWRQHKADSCQGDLFGLQWLSQSPKAGA